MADKYNMTSVYTPKTLYELTGAMAKNSNAVLVGGATDIMSSSDYFESRHDHDWILTGNVTELQKVYHSERYLEVGSAITVQQLLTTGAIALSKEVYRALSSISTSIIRNQMTLGGALFTKNTRYALSCIFATIGASCELKVLQRRGRNGRRITTSTKWIPVSKLYNEDGSLVYDKDVILTRIRIPVLNEGRQIFITLGDPKHNPDEAVFLGMQYKLEQNAIVNPDMCIAFPKGGFISSWESNVTSLNFPAEVRNVEMTAEAISSIVMQKCPDVSAIQCERLKRQYKAITYAINSEYLEG